MVSNPAGSFRPIPISSETPGLQTKFPISPSRRYQQLSPDEELADHSCQPPSRDALNVGRRHPHGPGVFGLGILEPTGSRHGLLISEISGSPPASPAFARPIYENLQRGSSGSSDGEASRPESYSLFSKPTDSEPSEIESQHLGTPASKASHPKPHKGCFGNINCPSSGNVLQHRTSWLSMSILFLAFYSTALSGLYLVVACVKPCYGKRIGSDGGMAPSTASLLSALLAKTVEVSFVTVFVAFLGQVLSRRAISKNSAGVSIADMSMRAWIMQPGTLITHWEAARYAAFTTLGVMALTATLIAMLYTTAADALVSPKLTFGSIENKILSGEVVTKFANPVYLENECQTPIPSEMDRDNGRLTCMQIAHVGQAYHNYQQYIANWGAMVRSGNSSSPSLIRRPPPSGTWYDNTTITGSWIGIQNMTELSMKYGRMVNNLTAAMPHAGVLASARDPVNSLRQPNALAGLGQYFLTASVPSPVVNALCAGMTEHELVPLIYTKSSGKSGKFKATASMTSTPNDIPAYPSRLEGTVVDGLFGFGKERGQPVFPKLPIPYNIVLDDTGLWPSNAIYLLAASPPQIPNPPYVLCSLKAGLTSTCSTQYHAAMSGGELVSHCEDVGDNLAYGRSVSDAPSIIWDSDWKNIAGEWARSLGLGAGSVDANASNSRLLTQLTPTFDNQTKLSSLNARLPSMAEALAVMAGSTLLMSSKDAQLVHFWNHSHAILERPEHQWFNATIRMNNYSSGGTEKWQGIFYVALALVFLINVICLVYLYVEIRGCQVADFTEPQNLFALALNSPSSGRLWGACGSGPRGTQLREPWIIDMEEQDEHYYIASKVEEQESLKVTVADYNSSQPDAEEQLKPPLSPAVKEFRSLSRSRPSLLS